MEFYRYLNVLRKHLGIIVLLALLGGGSALGFSLKQHKVYEATATLLINAAAPAALIPYLSTSLNGNGMAPVEQLANTYGIFLQSRSFDKAVIRRLHLAVTPDQLGARVSSALIPNTNYFTIKVTWGDPMQAATVATGIAQVFIQENAAAQAATQNTGPVSEINQSLNYFRHKIIVLQKQHDELVGNPNSNLAQVTSLEDKLSTLEDTYYKLLGTVGASAATQEANSATLSDPAVPPSAPIAPHVKQNAVFGSLAGLFLGLTLAFLLDYLDYSLRMPEDLEELVGQAPLGVVAKIGAVGAAKHRKLFGRSHRNINKTGQGTAVPAPSANGHGAGADTAQLRDGSLSTLLVLDPQLVTLNHPKDPISEAFRALRTNLAFSSLDKPLKSLVVTSSLVSEGKTTVSANVAIAMAQAGKQVILVDADLRRPSIGKLFNLHPTTGFTTVLLNREDRARALTEALQTTMVPNLSVITSGPLPPNPAELLASESMTAVLRDLEARADLVIFDTPPMGPFTDAVVLAARVSGTLVVVRAGSTRRAVITNGISTLRNVGGNVLGTVLNMVDVKAISNYSFYYYQAEHYGQESAATTARGR